MKQAPRLVLLRHGESVWNSQNIFSGWVDIPLSLAGIAEAQKAGKQISSLPIHVVFVSTLIRAQMSAMITMIEHKGGKTPVLLHPGEGKLQEWAHIYDEKTKENCIPVISAWELNERYYGELQGLNKDETRRKYGKEQVHIWRRSFDTAPPKGESLAMTAKRTIPYFKEQIVPYLKKGENVLITAHGNSLRSIIMDLEGLSKEEVVALELPTGEPLCYSYLEGHWQKEKMDLY